MNIFFYLENTECTFQEMGPRLNHLKETIKEDASKGGGCIKRKAQQAKTYCARIFSQMKEMFEGMQKSAKANITKFYEKKVARSADDMKSKMSQKKNESDKVEEDKKEKLDKMEERDEL